MPCPLCGDERSAPSWLGSTLFAGREFTYVECGSCVSLYCSPMPDAEALGLMYGSSYSELGGGRGVDDPKDPKQVVDWMRQLQPGVFVDYGCGGGELLVAAQRLGWSAVGVEFDPKVIQEVAKRTGARVVSRLDREFPDRDVDVINLGDVIEHLTNARAQVLDLLEVVRPGGLLIAQGPLEAQANVFTLGLRMLRTVRPRSRPAEFPPYHVMLATAHGQRTFFRSLGLEQIAFKVWEVDWPAPSRLEMNDLVSPRQIALFSLRRLSRLVTLFKPGEWGNRYFYVGRKRPIESHATNLRTDVPPSVLSRSQSVEPPGGVR